MQISKMFPAALAFIFILTACKSESADQNTMKSEGKSPLTGFWALYNESLDEDQTVFEFKENGTWNWFNEKEDPGTPTKYIFGKSQLTLSFKEGKSLEQVYALDMSSDSLIVMEAITGPKQGVTFVLKHLGNKAISIAEYSGTVGKDPLMNQSFKLSKRATILVRVKSDQNLLSTELANKQGSVVRSNIHSVWVGELLPSEFQLKIIGTQFPKSNDAKIISQKEIKFKIQIDQIK